MDLKTIKGVKRLFITLIALIVVVGAMLVISPLLSQNKKFAQEIATAEDQQNTAKGKLDKLQKQKDDLGKVEKLDDDLSVAFPASANTPGLVAYVSKATVDSGMSIENINSLTTGIPTLVASSVAAPPAGEAAAAPAEAPAAAPAPGATGGASNMAEMTVDISAKGSIGQLGQFVSNLTKGERNLLISGYSISTDAGSGDSTLSITAKTFIYKEIPRISEADTASTTPSTTPAPAPGSTTPVETPPAG